MLFHDQAAVEEELINRHRIYCPNSCFCKDAVAYEQSRKTAVMCNMIQALCGQPDRVDDLMRLTEQALLAMRTIRSLHRTHLNLLRWVVEAITKNPGDGRHLQRAGEWLELVMEIVRAFANPAGIYWKDYTNVENLFKAAARKVRAAQEEAGGGEEGVQFRSRAQTK